MPFRHHITPQPAEASNDIQVDGGCWGIRDFAAMFDVTPRTIRFYEDKGLLSPKRDKNTRIFDAVDHARFVKIVRAKRLGFTLDDIKEVLDVTDGHVKSRSELLRRKSNFEKVIQNLARRREDIDTLSRDMTEICAIIEQHIENTVDEAGVFNLAEAYQAKFRQSLVDDFATDIQPSQSLNTGSQSTITNSA